MLSHPNKIVGIFCKIVGMHFECCRMRLFYQFTGNIYMRIVCCIRFGKHTERAAIGTIDNIALVECVFLVSTIIIIQYFKSLWVCINMT